MDERTGNSLIAYIVDEDGAVETLSLVLWLPLVFSFFMFLADVSYILYSRSDLVRIAEDSTRARSIGLIETDLGVIQAIASRLPTEGSQVPSIQSSVSLGVIRTAVSVPISMIDMLGIVARISGDASVTIVVHQFKENLEV
ncbi:hypothetical protein [Jannaschia formosa]|uniref:hypothetical protein n=1 Tax=Jannaschia formosa TaxID=2259592 RepID=UPI000E1B6E6E|nr:hypothetical protein [Jannaschia formosa]TFL15990.1 hypothetical protein DR046_22445 [Jannaschia formosa]